ncbi:MAG: ImmA/IrrE family metallo-endopeptidase [Reyranellaceae bacterium]
MGHKQFCDATACNARKQTIEAFASQFAVDIGYTAGGSLRPIIEKLGGKIIYQSLAELGGSEDASVRVHGKGRFDIYLPDLTSPERDRFSIAHELGHYVLHYPLKNQPMKAARFGSNRVEWEANWFAAGFLMPATEFKAVHAKKGGNLAAVAAHFRVSTAAAEARAKALALG